MNKQRGQDLVEFALLMPLFFIFIFGIMYCGFAFGDYITLNNEARSAAREAVIGVGSLDTTSTTENISYDDKVKNYYREIIQNYDDDINKKGMMTMLYQYKGMLIADGKNEKRTISSIENLKQVPNDVDLPENSVIVIIQTKLNTNYMFPRVLEGFGVSILDGYQVRYIMYNENGTKSNS